MLNPVPATYDYRPPTDPWLTVIHADDDIVVLDKPSGLLSVPGKDPALADCLEARVRGALAHARPWRTGSTRTRPASSSCASTRRRSAMSARSSSSAGRRNPTSRACGARWRTRPASSTCRSPPTGRTSRASASTTTVAGQSRTEWQVEAREPGITRVRLHPLTGRTHQLRVHMLALGHPILGDQFYATGEALAAADRLQLHAEELGFNHPQGGWVEFRAPAPF